MAPGRRGAETSCRLSAHSRGSDPFPGQGQVLGWVLERVTGVGGGRGGLWVCLQICAEGYASQIWGTISDSLGLKTFLLRDFLEITAEAVIPTASIVVSLL